MAPYRCHISTFLLIFRLGLMDCEHRYRRLAYLSNNFFVSNLRWFAAGFLLTFTSSLGQTFFIALFANDLRTELYLSHGEFGGIYTAATLLSAAAMIWIGRTADVIATHIIAGLVLGALAAASLVMSQVNSAFMLFVTLFALRLFGQAMPGHIATTAMARWYSSHRGRALAITGLGRATSGAVIPGIFVALIALLGWRGSWIAAALATLFIVTPYCMWALSRPPNTNVYTQNCLCSDHSGVSVRDWTRAEVIRDPLFYALLIGVIAPPFILTGVFFHASYVMSVKSLTIIDYAAVFPLYAVSSLFASLAAGWAIDRWGAVQLLSVYLVPLAIGLVVLCFANTITMVALFMILAGASDGLSATLVSAMWAELYGTLHLGAIRSLAVSGMVASTSISPGAVGILIDNGIDIESQILAASFYVSAIIIFFFILRARSSRLHHQATQR